MLNDMRWYILRNFQIARDILKPLYEVARLKPRLPEAYATFSETFSY